MKPSEIKVGHMYYVDFEPHRPLEFAKRHLAIVLKKNHDKVTFVVVPMTSKDGSRVNKLPLGKLDCLPKNLQQKDAYVVVDQVRTVNSSRFSNLFENHAVFEAVVPEELMVSVYRAVIRDLLHDVSKDTLLKILA